MDEYREMVSRVIMSVMYGKNWRMRMWDWERTKILTLEIGRNKDLRSLNGGGELYDLTYSVMIPRLDSMRMSVFRGVFGSLDKEEDEDGEE